MLIIPVKEGESIDKALKRFKRKFDKTGALKSLRSRQSFIKPSVKNRNKFIKAAHIQKLKDQQSL
ncbi:MAG: 30S ribosomal protein S21 [Bacteroidota bacterium]|nr:30S ribosomal protein S21 [Bacteroidota bacterium]